MQAVTSSLQHRGVSRHTLKQCSLELTLHQFASCIVDVQVAQDRARNYLIFCHYVSDLLVLKGYCAFCRLERKT
jgi:hypothetical protein